MSQRLFQTKDRAESHAQLERVLIEGSWPRAECREYPNEEFPYQVWSEPDVRDPVPVSQQPPPSAPELNVRFTDEELNKIGAAMALHLKGGQS